MATPQFKNMNELIEYLSALEDRIRVLEDENQALKIAQSKNIIDGNLASKLIYRYLPKSNLFSSGFLKRAFAVWGHFFVANLIIGTIAGVLYFCFIWMALSTFLGNTNPTP